MKIAGIGFRSGASLASILDALTLAGGAGLRRINLPEDKMADPLIDELKAAGFELVPIPRDRLAGAITPTQSAISLEIHGTGSVAEACVLAMPHARLLSPRVVSADRMATAALAEIQETP